MTKEEEDVARGILSEVQQICDNHGMGIQAADVLILPADEGAGYAVNLSIPPGLSPTDPSVIALAGELEALPSVSRVQVILATE